MDQLMWVVTFIALSLAVGMSVIAARLLRGDQQRSAARVAALESASYALDDAAEETSDADGMFDDFREPDAVMFGAAEEPRAPSRRWLALGAVALVMAGLIGTGYVLFKPASLGASPEAMPAPSAPSSFPTAAQPTGKPIELLSLKHTIYGGTFRLAGLVQNPIDGAQLEHVVAVVYLFDNDGAYFATGRADLEFRGLRPGEESPFQVKIASTAHVGRYRVGFRREDGSVIAHVDKRGQTMAGLMTEGKN